MCYSLSLWWWIYNFILQCYFGFIHIKVMLLCLCTFRIVNSSWWINFYYVLISLSNALCLQVYVVTTIVLLASFCVPVFELMLFWTLAVGILWGLDLKYVPPQRTWNCSCQMPGSSIIWGSFKLKFDLGFVGNPCSMNVEYQIEWLWACG